MIRDTLNLLRLLLPAPSDAALAPDLEPRTMSEVYPIDEPEQAPPGRAGMSPHCDGRCPGGMDCPACQVLADEVTERKRAVAALTKRVEDLEAMVCELIRRDTALRKARP